ncbi:hypothetical protein [Flavobacterium sp. 14A]|uniref:hypothetical protein n=1 Tax=Flavobacterium sp. 14A TaxID=2735896 RepID=UPI00156E7F42|nr:hypothetical protein [Flavobacterium sp. 14A]NRT11153.1 hypothetical protein [Flavobacterium sp. 14A]
MKRTKTGGRAANTPNKVNGQAKELIRSVVDAEIARIPALLDKLKPKDRLDVVIKLMSFVVPKQTKIEIDIEEKRFTPLIINIQAPPEPLKLNLYEDIKN